MTDQILKKSILKYTLLVSTSFIFILFFVSIFTYIGKNNEADIISLNIRNDLIIGDYRSVHQALSNTLLGSSSFVKIFNNKNELIISVNIDKNSTDLFNLSVNKFLSSTKDTNVQDFKIVFYNSLYNPLINSILIWLLLAIVALPYINIEKKKIIEQMNKASELEKRHQELKWLQLSRKMFHDIRSPLASLNTIASDLNFANHTNQTLFSNSISRINEIANSLLSSTQNQLIKLPEFTPMQTLLEYAIDEKRLEYPHAKFIQDNNLQSNSSLIVPEEFKRIFSNLINNAIEASGPHPIIKIRSMIADDKITIDIEDNGTGIPEIVMENLGKVEISSKKSGNGIGFKDASETLAEWGGSLSIVKTNAEGTIIRMALQSKLEPLSYYLIDDDALVRMTWEAKAKKSGINLTTFSSANDFDVHKNTFDKISAIYIDSELGNIKGESIAFELHSQGFTNLHITSGHSPETFKEFTFLKSIISKAPPF